MVSAGNCSITANQAGNTNYDAAAPVTVSFAITPAAPTIIVRPVTLPDGTAGAPYSETLTASGGVGPYSFSTSGTLPTGLALTGSTISGSPSAVGSFNFSVTATDANGIASAARHYNVEIGSPTITISPSTLTDGSAGEAYSQTLTASGGSPPYTFSLTARFPA